MQDKPRHTRHHAAVSAAALGLFLCLLAVLVLSGPGRIDIVDGQTRYEVARSLVDHGDTVIRNPAVWFGVFPGRNGTAQTTYRFPQSLLGVGAVIAADATGPHSEARRHFFFALTSAVVGAALATVYFWWFIHRGATWRNAAFWATAGLLCTPSWFYSTSTFDDILGALAVTAAIVVACRVPGRRTLAALAGGLLIGLAFNCKQPLAVFGLAVAAAVDEPDARSSDRFSRLALVCVGIALGIAVYLAFDAYKFPPGTKSTHGPLLDRYVPPYPGHFPLAVVLLLVSPAAGTLWYHPAILLSLEGMRNAFRDERRLITAVVLSSTAFLVFVATMSIFKGDPAWGPRYLTPAYATLWLFAPESARRFRRKDIAWLLVVGSLVQAAALTVDPHRLYVKRGLPSAFGAMTPVLYWLPENSHLMMRPEEVREVWRARSQPGERFSPASSPTAAFPIIDEIESGESAVRKYKILNSFRPWLASFRYVPASERPVSPAAAAAALGGVLLGGVCLLVLGLRSTARQD